MGVYCVYCACASDELRPVGGALQPGVDGGLIVTAATVLRAVSANPACNEAIRRAPCWRFSWAALPPLPRSARDKVERR